MKIILHILIVFVLTVLTQIGGLVYLSSILIFKNKKWKYLYFIIVYSFISFLVVPHLAPIFGREKIKETNIIKANTFLTKLLNRNYVNAELNTVLKNTSKGFNKKYPNLKLVYLDANFPFIDNFPLLPHKSHTDGKKIDLAFIYTENSKLTNKKPSFIGYGVYENAKKKEYNQNIQCKKQGYWQYDFTKYLAFYKNKNLVFSEKATKAMILEILKQKNIQKIFIEPHLKTRLKLNNDKIRFQGCKAVRHDDHIHIQIK